AEALPAAQIKLGPLRLRRRPIAGGAPFISAHHPESHRGFVWNSRIDSFEPLVVPAQHFVVECLDRPVEMGRTGKNKPFWAGFKVRKQVCAPVRWVLDG